MRQRSSSTSPGPARPVVRPLASPLRGGLALDGGVMRYRRRLATKAPEPGDSSSSRQSPAAGFEAHRSAAREVPRRPRASEPIAQHVIVDASAQFVARVDLPIPRARAHRIRELRTPHRQGRTRTTAHANTVAGLPVLSDCSRPRRTAPQPAQRSRSTAPTGEVASQYVPARIASNMNYRRGEPSPRPSSASASATNSRTPRRTLPPLRFENATAPMSTTSADAGDRRSGRRRCAG